MRGTARPFSHLPLDKPKRQLRVVTIRLPSTDGVIRCELSTLDIQINGNIYLALSYLWGPSTPEYRIQLNGQDFYVRENLWNFLHVGQTRFALNPIFIDAMCIDQVNITERNSQVQLMGDIYLHSVRVLSWLGQGDTDLGNALPFVKSISKVPSAELGKMHQGDSDNRRAKQRIWLGIYRLCNLRYWTRVWIVQELIKPKEILLLYGNTEILWEILQQFLLSLRQANRCPAPLPTELFSSRMAQFVDARQDSIDGQIQGTMRDVLLMYGSSACSESRDCVFALLSLSLVAPLLKLNVDSAMPLSDLFLRVVKLWGSEGGANRLILAKHMVNNLLSSPDIVEGKENELKDFVLKIVQIERLEQHEHCVDISQCSATETRIQSRSTQGSQNGLSFTEQDLEDASRSNRDSSTILDLGQVKHSQLRCDDVIFQLEDTSLYLIGRPNNGSIDIVAILSVVVDEVDRESRIVARWLPWLRSFNKNCALHSLDSGRYEFHLNALLLRSFLILVNHYKETIKIIEPSGHHRPIMIESLSWEAPDGVSFAISAIRQVQALYHKMKLLNKKECASAPEPSELEELSMSQAHQALKSSSLNMMAGRPPDFVPIPSWKELIGRN